MHLLSEQTQAALAVSGALPVLEGVSIYAGKAGYEALEAAANLPLLVPPAFGTDWREALEAITDAFLAGAITSGEGLERLQASLGPTG